MTAVATPDAARLVFAAVAGLILLLVLIIKFKVHAMISILIGAVGGTVEGGHAAEFGRAIAPVYRNAVALFERRLRFRGQSATAAEHRIDACERLALAGWQKTHPVLQTRQGDRIELQPP